MVNLTSKHPDPGDCWHRIDRIGHLAVRAGTLRVGEDRTSLLSEVGHSLEVLRHTEVVEEDIRNPGGVVPEAGNLGSSREGIDCMD